MHILIIKADLFLGPARHKAVIAEGFSNLRRKIGAERIKTARGVGYMFVA